jgi:hypothetical protein
VCKLRRAQQPSDRSEEEIWTVGFSVQGAVGAASRKNGSRPLDLGPITHQSLDRIGDAQGLPSGIAEVKVPKGIWASGYRHSGYWRS